MSVVFVLDTHKRPVNPVHPGQARRLLSTGQAAVYRRYPFTIVLKWAIASPTSPTLRLKLDPGSTTTGIAIVNDATGEVVFGAELAHRGAAIKASLDARRAVRRNRRQRKTRYRQPRFHNRRRPDGWLPPSLVSRVSNIMTWVRRLLRICPIAAISQELVRFDTQAMEHAEIQGVEYQQGELMGYETRQYLLAKWNHTCAYCGKRGVPLQVEHIQPCAKGGTNRVSNLTLACEPCNRAKGTQDIREFLKHRPEVLARLLAQAEAPLRDVAAVNTTRWTLYHRLQTFGLLVEVGTGGRTNWNRRSRGLPKTHWLDAANVGASTPAVLKVRGMIPWSITATGQGSRQMCRMDKYGFVRTRPKQSRSVKGFRTGDLVRAVVPTGKKVGTYVGRVAVRATGSFNITTAQGTIQGIHHRYCALLQHGDGYSYQKGGAAFPPRA